MKVNKLKVFNEREVEALSQQWIEYVEIYMKTFSPSHHDAVLNELNLALGCQSFLGGNVISKADETVFTKLHEIMAKMSFQEKEKLINLSRWYSTVQSMNNNTALLKFSRTPLY